MQQQLYHTVLYLAGCVNILIAMVLLYGNYWFRYYDVYRRARLLTALNYTIFGIGILMHGYFQWRLSWPAAASALTVSYFHCGAVLFGWSHTSLLRPNYLTHRIVVRDLIILVFGITIYWTCVAFVSTSDYTISLLHNSFLIFFFHASYIIFIFYRTYFQVRRNLNNLPIGDKAPKWWNLKMRKTILSHHHSFIIACHLIVSFGLGSIALTAAFPHDIWPVTILTMAGIGVFCFIFYSLSEYGNVIEQASCVTEDAAK